MSSPGLVIDTPAGNTATVIAQPSATLQVMSPSSGSFVVTDLVTRDDVSAPTITHVTTVAEGASGPAGPPGPPGRDGLDGDAGVVAPYVHNQVVPAGSVIIAHDRGYYPQVEVVDADGNRIGVFGCRFPTINTALLTFLSPIAFVATFS